MRILTLTGEKGSDNEQLISRYHSMLEGVEIRLDILSAGEKDPVTAAARLQSKAEQYGLQTLLTCRRKADGGNWPGNEEERLSLMEQALKPGMSFVDCEEMPPVPPGAERRLEERAAQLGIRLIGSLHDLHGIPKDWPEQLRRISAKGRLPKLACTPAGFAQAAEMYRISRTGEMPAEKILLLMGPYGYFSRILYRRFGSFCTFVSDPARRAVPWHPDPQELSGLYRAQQVGEETPLYGVIGNPVHHSKSPQLHNRWLQALGLPGTYLPFQVDAAEAFFTFARETGVRGFSVTLPLKQAVLPYLDSQSPEVERIGSCNTVVWQSGGWRGYNTDFDGFLAPLEPELNKGALQRALVIGAGGVARTAAAALTARGLKWVCVNRTQEKARRLAEELGGRWTPQGQAAEAGPFDLIVQTTSAGMEPDTQADPLPHYTFSGEELVYELIYAPEVTRFMQRAKAAGCKSIGGAAMLRAQARRQFLLFTGWDAPADE